MKEENLSFLETYGLFCLWAMVLVSITWWLWDGFLLGLITTITLILNAIDDRTGCKVPTSISETQSFYGAVVAVVGFVIGILIKYVI